MGLEFPYIDGNARVRYPILTLDHMAGSAFQQCVIIAAEVEQHAHVPHKGNGGMNYQSEHATRDLMGAICDCADPLIALTVCSEHFYLQLQMGNPRLVSTGDDLAVILSCHASPTSVIVSLEAFINRDPQLSASCPLPLCCTTIVRRARGMISAIGVSLRSLSDVHFRCAGMCQHPHTIEIAYDRISSYTNADCVQPLHALEQFTLDAVANLACSALLPRQMRLRVRHELGRCDFTNYNGECHSVASSPSACCFLAGRDHRLKTY